MPQSTWDADAMGTIDGTNPGTAYASACDLGFFYGGGAKAFVRRVLIGFDLNSAPSAGRMLVPSDAVVSASLVLCATVVVGPVGWGAKASRVARADWDDATATWSVYKTGSPWTAAGGDVASPPPEVSFASPSSLGDFTITGMDAHVTDALANRSGLLLVRLKADVEADAGGVSRYVSGSDLHAPAGPRLVVTYASADPAPIDRPDGAVGVATGARASRLSSAARSSTAAVRARASRPT